MPVLLAAAFILRDVIANRLMALPRDAAALRGLVLIVAVSAAYVGHVKLIERRAVRELAVRRAPQELGLGLIVGAALFGLLHVGNENASWLGTVTITATAGIFLAGVYILTRRLWVAIGAHYAVNLTQGPVLGLPVSGRERVGLLQSTLSGSDLLTGGSYGIEASLITAAIGLAVAGYVVWRGYVNGRFVGPLWTRRQDLSNGGILSDLR